MGSAGEPDVTALLRAWTSGDRAALNRLITVLHPELRRIAQRYMGRERPGHTLQTTALVNEAYMRLIDIQRVEWHDRAHFLAVSAELMRRVLVDHARSHGYQKRGGAAARVSLEECALIQESQLEELLDLDEALIALAKVDKRKARVVELRFFGGLNADEVAAVLGVSAETVHRDWKLSKVWLTRQMSRPKETI
jgi:RNA polymerase sigma factor (TIGR02999 family)